MGGKVKILFSALIPSPAVALPIHPPQVKETQERAHIQGNLQACVQPNIVGKNSCLCCLDVFHSQGPGSRMSEVGEFHEGGVTGAGSAICAVRRLPRPCRFENSYAEPYMKRTSACHFGPRHHKTLTQRTHGNYPVECEGSVLLYSLFFPKQPQTVEPLKEEEEKTIPKEGNDTPLFRLENLTPD